MPPGDWIMASRPIGSLKGATRTSAPAVRATLIAALIGRGIFIGYVDVIVDGLNEVADALKGAASNLFPGNFSKPALDLFEPRRTSSPPLGTPQLLHHTDRPGTQIDAFCRGMHQGETAVRRTYGRLLLWAKARCGARGRLLEIESTCQLKESGLVGGSNHAVARRVPDRLACRIGGQH